LPPSLIKVVIAQLTRRRDRAESQALPPLGPRSFPYPISSIFDQPRLKLHHHLFACVRACVCSPEPPSQNVLSMDENTLEDVELPLRHFFSASGSDNQGDSDMLLPAPAPSIRDQILQINFESPLQRIISLSLAVDAGPGCGGIAWPAGQVCSLFHPALMSDVAYCQFHLFLHPLSSMSMFRPIFLTTCVIRRSWRATLPGVDPLLRV